MLKWRKKGARAGKAAKNNIAIDTASDSSTTPAAHVNTLALSLPPAPQGPEGENLKLQENSLLLANITGIVITKIIDTDKDQQVSRAVRLQLNRFIYLEFRSAEVLSHTRTRSSKATKRPANKSSDKIEVIS
ncbi:hypothetical protein OXX80_003522 [Metschnikowia pulcherrima]